MEPGETLREIAARKIPVILPETLALPIEEDDAYDAPFTLPGELHRAGVLFAFGSFSVQFARNLPFQAANAVGSYPPGFDSPTAMSCFASSG